MKELIHAYQQQCSLRNRLKTLVMTCKSLCRTGMHLDRGPDFNFEIEICQKKKKRKKRQKVFKIKKPPKFAAAKYKCFVVVVFHLICWTCFLLTLNGPIPTNVFCFVVCWNVLELSLKNSVDPDQKKIVSSDQTNSVGAVWSRSTLFVFIL